MKSQFIWLTYPFSFEHFNLFQLLKNGTYSGLPQMVSTLSFVILLLFLFCYSGTQVTERFNDIGDEVYALEWYVLPLNLQRNIPMIMALSNQEIYLRGLGGYHYTHETFKKVNKNSLLWLLNQTKYFFLPYSDYKQHILILYGVTWLLIILITDEGKYSLKVLDYPSIY